jgi:hypothetical protein
MTVKPSAATLVDLQAGASNIGYHPEEVVSITMKTRVVDPNGQVCNAGGTYSVPKAFGQLAIESGWASDAGNIFPLKAARTVDPNALLVGSVTYNVSDQLTSLVADGVFYKLEYPDANTIDIYVGAQGKRITLDASQKLVSVAPL